MIDWNQLLDPFAGFLVYLGLYQDVALISVEVHESYVKNSNFVNFIL